MKNKLAVILVLFLTLTITSVAAANSRGPIVANNIMGGAGAGTAVGLSAGIMAYGLNHHRDPGVLLTSSVYGFLAGAVAGTGIGVYEISTGSNGTGFTVSEYVVGGTGIGALVGVVVAIIPFTDNGSWENFTIGAGLGGLIGGTFGLGFALFDLNSGGTQGGKDVLLSGQIGVYPDVIVLTEPFDYDQPCSGEPVLSCRLVKLTF